MRFLLVEQQPLAAITGSIAPGSLWSPEWIQDKAYSYLDEPLKRSGPDDGKNS